LKKILEAVSARVFGTSFAASAIPGFIMVDGYDAIMAPGFEVILTQARSLGLATALGVRSCLGMKGSDGMHYRQIVENVGTKVFVGPMADDLEGLALAGCLFGSCGDLVRKEDLANQAEDRFSAFSFGEAVRGRIVQGLISGE
jgi:intracellular multiplication protein IcmO